MAIGCGPKCAKIALVIFNGIFLLSGILIIVMAVFGITQLNVLTEEESQKKMQIVCGVLIGVGVIVAIISFCGCCGAWKESKCLLMTFAVFLSLIVICEIAIGIYLGINFKKLKVQGNDDFNRKYNQSESFRNSAEMIFKSLKCCGMESADMFRKEFPNAKCPEIATEGCGPKVFDKMKKNGQTIIGLSIGLGLIEIIGIVFACMLMCNTGSDGQDI